MTSDDSGLRRHPAGTMLLEAARRDGPDPRLAQALIDRVLERKNAAHRRTIRRWLVASGVATAAVAAAAAAALALQPSQLLALSEPPTSPRVQQHGSGSHSSPDPCLLRVRGLGASPLIDDFEDGDPWIFFEDGREGSWELISDRTAPSGGPFEFAPSRHSRAERRQSAEVTLPASTQAMQLKGGEHRDWGISLEVKLTTSRCYDASAYAGLQLTARGPGRIYLAAREVRMIASEHGGTCKNDCYNSHTKPIDLKDDWQLYQVKWSELRQRGYGLPALDPTSLYDVQVLVRGEDTPFDLWIDDMSFLPAPPAKR